MAALLFSADHAGTPEMARKNGGHAQLSEVVATQLREMIVAGKLKPGQFLRIDAIAKMLGVSMTPVREGLLLLQSESFVRLLPRRGFVVNSFSKGDVLDLFWAQAVIAAELASRAATAISDQEIERLKHVHTAYEAAVAAGAADRDRLGHEFHRSINLAANSPRLALMLGSLTRQLPNRFYASIEGQLNSALDFHPLILRAIQLRDGEMAGSLMRRHIYGGGEQLVEMLERQGLWSSASEKSAESRKPVVARKAAKSGKKKKAAPRARTGKR
jgi:DNA-binding GntR family transcriptional regulator